MRTQKVLSAAASAALAIVVITTPAAAQGTGKAQEVLAAARKGIGDQKLEALKTFTAEARLQRNVGTFQANADVELFLELPDKYAKSEIPSGQMMNVSSRTGFNGDKPLARLGRPGGNAMMIRMGPNGPEPIEKPTPEQEAEMARVSLRAARHEASRLMLGWFAMAHPALKAEYTYAGEAESADGKADVIDVKDTDGFAARLFIDQQTHLPLMVTYQAPRRMVMGGSRITTRSGGAPAQGSSAGTSEEAKKKAQDGLHKQLDAMRDQPPVTVEYRVYFGEWSDMEGIRFPVKLQRAVEGTPEEEWTISRIKLNPKIDAKKFDAGS